MSQSKLGLFALILIGTLSSTLAHAKIENRTSCQNISGYGSVTYTQSCANVVTVWDDFPPHTAGYTCVSWVTISTSYSSSACAVQ